MNDINDKIDKLFDNLESQKVFIEFQSIKKQLINNKDIMHVINEIKRYQKIATTNKDLVLEKRIKELYDKLNSYPLYQSYLIKKDIINEELFMIKNIFEKYFYQLLALK